MGISKKEAKEELKGLVAKFDRERASGKILGYNEENTKKGFIEPLLKDVLGWDVTNIDEVGAEERVSKKRVDYSLKVDGRPKVYIEAKPPKADLRKEQHVRQAINYGYIKGEIYWVLLTGFEEFRLFDVSIKPDRRNPEKGLRKDLRYDQYIERFKDLWLLSKESVCSGELDKLLLKKPTKDHIGKAILEDLKMWREALAKNIYKNNPEKFHTGDSEKDANFLKECTQKILDRIIFMRSCEDRGLTSANELKDLVEGRTKAIMLLLKDKFRHYNITFNSDLFVPHECENLDIDFKVLSDIILETYNPYQFDVIPLEVLGNIYEQYLGYIPRLTDKQVKYELKPQARKAGGVYYTPEYIVDYIVKNTVGRLLKELKPKDAQKIRILDPACGSGSFLIRAYQEMLDYYLGFKRKKGEKRKERERQKPQERLDLKDEPQFRLDIQEKRDILLNHIFGVDIDEQAVEVTKLSLMLKMLEGEGEYQIFPQGRLMLPVLDSNIKCGNSLISGSVQELKEYFGDDWYKVKPFNWSEAFRRIMAEEGGFDVVIGNPPYVKYENLDGEIREYAKIHYECAKGFFDIFQLFLERAFNLLEFKGSMGFIFPNLFLKGMNYKFSRGYFYKRSKIEIIKNYGDGVFENVKMPTCVVILKKEKSVKNLASFFIKNNLNEFVEYSIKQEDFENENFVFGITNICDSLQENSIKLQQLVDITRGLEIGRDRVVKAKLKGVKIIFGEDISRYSIKNVSCIDRKTYNNYKKNEAIFTNGKIVIRETGGIITATYDNTGLVTNRSLYCIRSQKINLKYLLAIVNSKIIQYFYENRFKSDTEIFPKIRIAQVKEIPIKATNFSNPTEKRLHDDLVALVDVMLDLNKKAQTVKGSEKDQIQRQIEKTDREIDDLVYKLYGITEEERKVIEGKEQQR